MSSAAPGPQTVSARPDSPQPAFDAAHVAVVCSWVATAAALCFVLSRLGFGSHMPAVLKLLGGSYFLLLFPVAYQRWSRQRGRNASSWTSSDAAALLMVLSGMTAIGWVLWGGGSLVLSLLVPAFGAALAVDEWRRFLASAGVGRAFLLAAGVVVFVSWSFSAYHLGRDPLFLENLQATGDTSIDTWFHVAIAHTIRTYRAVSTGLDGLLFANYHFGSHWLFAQLSTLLDVPPLHFYLIGFQVLIVPLFINCLGIFVIEARRRLGRRPSILWPWTALAVATVGYTYLDSISVTRNETIAQSESLCVSMIILFIAATLVMHAYDDATRMPSGRGWRDRVFWCALLPALIGASGLAKVSTMTLAVVALGYLFLRLRLFAVGLFRLAFVIGVTAAAGVSALFIDTSTRMPIVAFDYLNQYVLSAPTPSPSARIALFIVCRFLGVWVIAAIVIREAMLARRSGSERRPAPVLALEVAALIAVIGVVPGSIWAMPAGAAGYFIAVQTWLALAFVMALGGSRPHATVAVSARPARPVRALRAAGMAVVGLAIYLALANLSTGQLLAFVKQNGAIRTKILLADPRNEGIVSAFETQFDAAIVSRHWREGGRLAADRYLLRGGTTYVARNPIQILQTLEQVAALPNSEKRHSMLFVPRTNQLFWGGRQRNHLANNVTPAEMPNFLYGGGGLNLSCDTLPFLAPALTGMAMLDGLPEAPCKATYYLYFDYYAARAGRPLFTDDEADAYRRAVAQGFSQLVVLDQIGGQAVIRRVNADTADHRLK